MEPPAAAAQPGDLGLHPAFYIASWMFLSNATILFNKYLLDTAGFPITLTGLHLTTAVVLTRLLARYTTLIPRPRFPMTGRLYLRTVLPIGVLYTVSLVCANLVYLYLSVSFIQMLKALAPVVTLLMSWAASLSTPRASALGNVLVIALGVAVAGLGEVEFSWVGFAVQLFGTIAESGRLLLVQKLLSGPTRNENASEHENDKGHESDNDHEHHPDVEQEAASSAPSSSSSSSSSSQRGIASMNPLVGLYYFAPVCAALNMTVAALVEFRTFDFEDLHRVGYGTLLLNCVVAFMLNVAGVFLIGKTSALTMNLSGILKSILLVGASIVIWATPITFTQVVGYAIALAGMFYYSLPPEGLGPQAKVLGEWLGGNAPFPQNLPGRLPTREDVSRKAQEVMKAGGDLLGVEVVADPGGEAKGAGSGPGGVEVRGRA